MIFRKESDCVRSKNPIIVRESIPKYGQVYEAFSPKVSRIMERKPSNHYLNNEEIVECIENLRPKCIKE